jgi:hypothetical protein
MKGFRVTTILGVFLLISAYRIQAQTTDTKPDQIELIKYISGTWETVPKGSFPISKERSFAAEMHGNSMIPISVAGQTVNKKTQLGIYQRLKEYENFHHPKKLITSKGYQFKSAMGGVQKIDSAISEVWDTLTSQWVEDSKVIFTYDEYGNTIFFRFRWETISSQWISMTKDEETYDSYGNEILWIEYIWDQTNNQWVLDYKDERAYDGYGNITLRYTY